MTIVRWICDIGVGVIAGVLLTGSVVYHVLEELGSISIGFMTGSPNYPWIIKMSLVIGIVHGLLVALGVILSFRTDTTIGNILAGLVSTEIGIALVQFYLFTFSDSFAFWWGEDASSKIGDVLGYFLVPSAILLVPTVLVALVVAKVDRLFTRI